MKYEAETHSHTIASGHAYNTIMEMTRAAADKNLRLMSFTDHAPSIPGAPGLLFFSNYSVIERNIYGVDILMGVELNIIDYEGSIDLPTRLLKKQDICIASIHSQCIQSGGIEKNTRSYLGAMDNPYVDILGHPDDDNYPIDYEMVINKAAETGVIIEVNMNSFRVSGIRKNPINNIRKYIPLCKAKRVPVVIGSDAHFYNRVGVYQEAADLLEELDFPEELVLNSDAEKLKAYLKARKERAATR